MSARGKKAAVPKKKANGYKMPAPIANGEIIHDTLMKKKWRIGPSIGVGGFGEIYSACDHEATPKGSNYPFVIKIEPHENGPLFVEKHFYVRNANKEDIAKFMKSKNLSTFGMPTYFGNGSHEYKGEKYRYLVLERYDKDLWSIFLSHGRVFPVATVFQIGLQMLDVLEYIHSRGYVHADIKGANILLGLKKGTENQAYLVDFGLATRVTDKEFKPDPKCAHNGTIEYTSRDAHLGAPTMRGDLEILGYNMLQWIVGKLPWEKSLTQPKTVQEAKEAFMSGLRSNITKLGDVPDTLVKFFEYINTMKPKDVPDYRKCQNLFENYLKSLGKTRKSKLEFTIKKSKPVKAVVEKDSDTEDNNSANKISTKDTKRKRQPKIVLNSASDTENETPNGIEAKTKVVRKKKIDKRKSIEPLLLVNIKKTKLTSKATPPVKKNHCNTATQTSDRKVRQSPRLPRTVTFDSPVCQSFDSIKMKSNLSDQKNVSKDSLNSSRDIFEDSFVIEENAVKPKKRLICDEEVTVKRVVKKKLTTVKPKPKGRSWKDSATIVNGRSPPTS